MQKLFMLFLVLLYLNASSQPEIGYFLPKKIIYITVPFTITQQKLFNANPITGEPDGDPIKFVINVKVDGDIKVESKMYPSTFQNINLEPLGKGGKSFNFSIKFDETGNGLLTTINASQTPVTADIIKGTVNIAGSLIKLATGLLGMTAGEDAPKTVEQITEQKIVETRAIEITSDNPYSLTISPSIIAAGRVANPSASVEINITKVTSANFQNSQAANLSDNNNAMSLRYRVPAEHTIQVKVLNNQLIKEQIIISESILIPQTGKEISISIPILKRKKTFELGFDPATGNLSKYGLTKESQVSEKLESVNGAIGTLNTEITSLRTTIAENKDKEEKKIKQQEADNRNKDIKDQIEQLKLEKDRLDLLIEKHKLIDELAEKKKAQEEAKVKKSKGK